MVIFLLRNSTFFTAYNYIFNYTDHLGNIRMNYSLDQRTNNLKIMEEHHYYPFGLEHANYNNDQYEYVGTEEDGYYSPVVRISGRTSRNSYQYKFNSKEWQDELKLNMYDYGFTLYDPATLRRNNIDPKAENSRRWSPYSYCYNNPVYFIDPDGMQAIEGDYYNSNGQYLGNDGIDDNKVYVADSKNEDGTFNNATDLGVTHDEFAISANVVKHESGGSVSESLWIAHTANNAKDNNAIDYKKNNETLYDQLTDKSYSTTPATARTPLATTDTSSKANNARAGVIDVLSGGVDPTGGAVLWDGSDFLTKGASHNKFKEYKCVDIEGDALSTYSGAWSKKTPATIFNTAISGDTSFSGSGKNGRTYNLQSTGAQGKSIFWKIKK